MAQVGNPSALNPVQGLGVTVYVGFRVYGLGFNGLVFRFRA